MIKREYDETLTTDPADGDSQVETLVFEDPIEEGEIYYVESMSLFLRLENIGEFSANDGDEMTASFSFEILDSAGSVDAFSQTEQLSETSPSESYSEEITISRDSIDEYVYDVTEVRITMEVTLEVTSTQDFQAEGTFRPFIEYRRIA